QEEQKGPELAVGIQERPGGRGQMTPPVHRGSPPSPPPGRPTSRSRAERPRARLAPGSAAGMPAGRYPPGSYLMGEDLNTNPRLRASARASSGARSAGSADRQGGLGEAAAGDDEERGVSADGGSARDEHLDLVAAPGQVI